MGISVRGKRVSLINGFLNLSFALDWVDENEKPVSGVFMVESGQVLVGCTDKGRLCIMGDATDESFLSGEFTIKFIDSETRTEHTETTTATALLNSGSEDTRTSNVVGIGQVGYMII